MRASHAHPPPLPLPPPPLSLPSPSTVHRRRHRLASSSSSSSSLSSSLASTASYFSPSPSPAPSPRAGAAPRGTTSGLVPFSWERHPGIPKSCLGAGGIASSAVNSPPLPLPPTLRVSPLRHQPRRRRAVVTVPPSSYRSYAADPFAAAIVECTREDGVTDDNHDADAKTRPAVQTPTLSDRRSQRRWWLDTGGFVGFLDLYGCKSAMAVADGAFLVRRSVVARSCRTTRR
ncbi:hypothetical protein GUJ93_ZPchr0009g902 [Zizania palustris]|uniref:Uncharacterized protein n=1 Tax=Zizania palustris TaxID=103762 RepID=A0A8J5V4G4_ZIZPA|nr:hypothetical protein GUJ93_ZPchr0009g902 [Zizania palustris]